METYQKELSQIKAILKDNPKGMTVTDIAHEIQINRNSVAKYLDVLLISGQADMVTFGPAKVYFPSTRIPLSLILNYTHQYIAILNKDLRFLQVNDALLNALGIQRDDIIGQPIDTFTTSFFQNPEFARHAHQASIGKEATFETPYTENHQQHHLTVHCLPTIGDDSEPGITLIIDDVTDLHVTKASLTRCTQERTLTLNAITDLLFTTDQEYTVIHATKTFADFLHLPLDHCLGKKCYTLLHGSPKPPDSCPCAQAQLNRLPTMITFFEPHLHKNLAISGFPLLNEQGEATGGVHILREITDPTKKE